MKKVLLIVATFITYNTYAQKTDLQQVFVEKKSSENAAKQAMYLGFELINPDAGSYFPLRLFNLKGVKKMKVTSNENELFKDFVIEYKNNTPFKFVNKVQSLEFHYSGDTVILKDNKVLAVYTLTGDFLLNTKTYTLSESNGVMKKMILSSARLVKLPGDSIMLVSDQNNEPRYSASSSRWTLPFIREYSLNDAHNIYKIKDVYDKNKQGDLVLDKTLDKEDKIQLVYKMKDGRPVNITNPDSEIVKISYEYF